MGYLLIKFSVFIVSTKKKKYKFFKKKSTLSTTRGYPGEQTTSFVPGEGNVPLVWENHVSSRENVL